MHELSDDARSILDLARDADDPHERDRKRLTGAMAAQLGAAAVISSSTTLAAASGGSSAGVAAVGALGAAKLLGSIGIVSCLTVVALWQVARPNRQGVAQVVPQCDATAPQAAAPLLSSVAGAALLPLAPPALASSVQVATPSSGAAAAAVKLARARGAISTNALAEEVKVLATVRRLLRQGQAAEALDMLDGNSELFAHGALREEFLAARVLALRELGRDAAAQAAAQHFAEEMPHSALVPKTATSPTERVEK